MGAGAGGAVRVDAVTAEGGGMFCGTQAAICQQAQGQQQLERDTALRGRTTSARGSERIRTQISRHGLSHAQLQAAGCFGTPRERPGPAQYRNAQGQVWDGIGEMPDWLQRCAQINLHVYHHVARRKNATGLQVRDQRVSMAAVLRIRCTAPIIARRLHHRLPIVVKDDATTGCLEKPDALGLVSQALMIYDMYIICGGKL